MNQIHTLQKNDTLQGGKYKIEAVLGQGGFGITYLALHKVLQVEVAIKELYISAQNTYCTRSETDKTVIPHFDEDKFADFRKRFLEEAYTLARFRGVKGIVQVVDTFEENGTVYFVMEFIEGKSIKKLVEDRGTIPENEAVSFTIQILESLKAVHHKGVLHRDLNPNNIIIDPNGHPVLIDFGIAREFEEDVTITQTTFRTIGYSAPEQAVLRAKRGAFTDLYSIGGTLYFMLTGTRPQSIDEIELDGFKSPKDLNPKISQLLNKTVIKAINKKPSERFQSADEMMAALSVNSNPIQKSTSHQDDVTLVDDGIAHMEQKPKEPITTSEPEHVTSKPKKQEQPQKHEVVNTSKPINQKVPTEKPKTSKPEPEIVPAQKKHRHKALLITISAIVLIGVLIASYFGYYNYNTNKLYKISFATGNQLVEQGYYDSALVFYQKALTIKPSDGLAMNKIYDTKKLIEENKTRMSQFNFAMSYAEKCISENKFEEARKSLNDALTVAKKDSIDYVNAKIAECDKMISYMNSPEGRMKNKILGKHTLALQWISWDYFGIIDIYEENGVIKAVGEQKSREHSGDYLKVNGTLNLVSELEFRFTGEIITKIYHLNNGNPCTRRGTYTFKSYSGRQYWRMLEMDNPCDGVTDYVDIYFKKIALMPGDKVIGQKAT